MSASRPFGAVAMSGVATGVVLRLFDVGGESDEEGSGVVRDDEYPRRLMSLDRIRWRLEGVLILVMRTTSVLELRQGHGDATGVSRRSL